MSSISRAQRDHRLARPPGGDPRGGNAGHAALDLEAFLLQNAGEVLRGLEFLEAQLAEAEDAVHHHLRLLLHGVDLAGQVGLHGGFFLGSDFGLRQEREYAGEYTEGHEHGCLPHWNSVPDAAEAVRRG